MLPAKGMEPVYEMQIEEVNTKLRKHLRRLWGSKDYWGITHLGKMLAAGADIEGWRDTWARSLLIEMRSPDTGPMIDDGDDDVSHKRREDYEEF